MPKLIVVVFFIHGNAIKYIKAGVSMNVEKVIAVLLAGALLSGCASREVYFTSTPFGATVTVGQRTGVTPCTMKVSEGTEEATFTAMSGEEMTMPLPALEGDLDAAAQFGGKALGGTVMVAGGSVAVLGLLIFLSGFPDNNDDGFDTLSDEEDDWDGDAVGLGFLGMVAGGSIFFLGKWIYPEDAPPVLHADFTAEE